MGDPCPLSAQQLRIMRMRCDGVPYKAIAAQIGLSVSTVRTHIHHALPILGANDSAHAAVIMMRNGWHTEKCAPPQEEDFPISPWMRAYLHEFDRFLTGPVEDRDAARGRMSLALLGQGWRSGDRVTDRVPDRLMDDAALHPATHYKRRAA